MEHKEKPKKIKINGLTNEDHKYILCSNAQTYLQGHHITTKYDMDLYEDINDFLEALYKNKEISEVEKINTTTIYYKEKLDDHMSHKH